MVEYRRPRLPEEGGARGATIYGTTGILLLLPRHEKDAYSDVASLTCLEVKTDWIHIQEVPGDGRQRGH